MMRRKGGLAVAASLLLLSCSSPEPRFFTLVATPGTAALGTVAPGGPRTVMLRRPGIPGYLDRPDIVRTGGDYQIRFAFGERWGEPFGDLVGRILAEDLSRRLPGSSVYTEAGAISADPEVTLEVDFQRFDADPSGTVVLLVQWSAEQGRGNPGGPPVTNRITVTPASGSTGDVVAAMSTALGQEADTMAAALRALPPAQHDAAGPGRRRRPGR